MIWKALNKQRIFWRSQRKFLVAMQHTHVRARSTWQASLRRIDEREKHPFFATDSKECREITEGMYSSRGLKIYPRNGGILRWDGSTWNEIEQLSHNKTKSRIDIKRRIKVASGRFSKRDQRYLHPILLRSDSQACSERSSSAGTIPLWCRAR